jgi:hypothetical protein
MLTGEGGWDKAGGFLVVGQFGWENPRMAIRGLSGLKLNE